MKRLLSAGVMIGLLVAGASLSWAASNLNSSKSNLQKAAEGQKKAAKSTTVPATQDPCENVKNDPNQYAKCQDATHPIGLKNTLRRGGY